MTYRNLKTAVIAAIALNTVGVTASDNETDSTGQLVRQTPVQALEADVKLQAKATGASIAAVAEAIRFQQKFDEYVVQLSERYPDQLSRVWLEPAPNAKGYIQFVGRSPYAESAPAGVQLLENGRLTIAEHAERAELAAAALRKAGYVEFLTYFDVPLGTIRVEMVRSGAAPDPNRQSIIATIQSEIANGGALSKDAREAAPTDIDLRIIRSDNPIYTFDAARGGMSMTEDDDFECTSGWSVKGPSGDGIITAAHCTGLNGIGPHSTIWRDEERGNGDVEYHTTDGAERAEFYANATSIRDVTASMPTSSMYSGRAVCRYGRASNVRDCSHTIAATGVTVTYTDGVTYSYLVRVNGDSAIGGDSGGGYSYGTTAWGVHSGSNGASSFFTPVGRANIELGVRVKHK